MNQPAQPSPASAVDELKALPSLEDTTTQVQAAMSEITTAASQLIPNLAWQSLHGGTTGNCEGPYEQTDGKRYFLPDLVAVGAAVSETDWATIMATAKASAAKLGATDVQVMQDSPGHHDVSFTGPTGLFIKVGYAGNLGVSGYTGCRLPRSKT